MFSRSSPLPWSVVLFAGVLSGSCSAPFHTGDVTRSHPASISPWAPAIAAYVLAIYLGQVGYCILLVIARKPETKARSSKCDLHCLLLTSDTTDHNSQRCRSRSCICKLGHGRLGHCMGKRVSCPIASCFIQLVLGFRGIPGVYYPPRHSHPAVDIFQRRAHCVSRSHLAPSSRPCLHPCTRPTFLDPTTFGPIPLFPFVCFFTSYSYPTVPDCHVPASHLVMDGTLHTQVIATGISGKDSYISSLLIYSAYS